MDFMGDISISISIYLSIYLYIYIYTVPRVYTPIYNVWGAPPYMAGQLANLQISLGDCSMKVMQSFWDKLAMELMTDQN